MRNLVRLVILCLLATACGKTDSGTQVDIPTVTMACTASNCKANATFYTAMYITKYSCDEGSIDFSIAATSSSNVTCTASSGCQETFSNWINSTGGSVTSVGSGTYNLCGIVANGSFAGAWNGNVRAIGTLYGKKIDGTQGTINVSTWVNY